MFLWFSLEGLVPRRTTPKHLLWGLNFLKLYEVEEARARRLHVDEKTCRKWTSIFYSYKKDKFGKQFENTIVKKQEGLIIDRFVNHNNRKPKMKYFVNKDTTFHHFPYALETVAQNFNKPTGLQISWKEAN